MDKIEKLFIKFDESFDCNPPLARNLLIEMHKYLTSTQNKAAARRFLDLAAAFYLKHSDQPESARTEVWIAERLAKDIMAGMSRLLAWYRSYDAADKSEQKRAFLQQYKACRAKLETQNRIYKEASCKAKYMEYIFPLLFRNIEFCRNLCGDTNSRS